MTRNVVTDFDDTRARQWFAAMDYAKARKYLLKDHEELDAVARAKDREGEIEVFTPVELAEILNCADEALISFLTLGAFAGIRHAEIQ